MCLKQLLFCLIRAFMHHRYSFSLFILYLLFFVFKIFLSFDDSLQIMSYCSVISPQHQSSTTTSPPHTVSDAIPNKSSLFNHSSNNVNNINSRDNFESKSQSSAPKINHGKPNLAPKPPPLLSLPMNNNNTSNVNISNNSLNDGSRKSVARHQSMKSPRYYAICVLFCFLFSSLYLSVLCALCQNQLYAFYAFLLII